MQTIILIHGAWVTPKSWDPFKHFFQEHGYKVIAPPWPGKERSVNEQQNDPDQSLATLGIREIVDYYAGIIKKEPEPPILIGHSFGGLFVEMLLDQGLGKAGIAIDPAPPKGVFALYPSALWSLRLPITTPGGWKKVLRWPFSHFAYAFTNTLSLSEQKLAFQEFIVPESGRVFWQAALAPFNDTAYVDFSNPKRPPLLIIAGEKDHIVPAAVNKSNYKKYERAGVPTDFKEFSGRSHWIIAQPGWEKVAEYCESWVAKNAK